MESEGQLNLWASMDISLYAWSASSSTDFLFLHNAVPDIDHNYAKLWLLGKTWMELFALN